VQLQGRRVLVTGASRGIGESVARSFAARGARVALVARSEAAIKTLAHELGGTAYPAHLSMPEQVNRLVAGIEADGGPIDILVNNAGIAPGAYGPAMSQAEVAETFQVNLLAPVSLCRQAIPGMVSAPT
jgi:NAD(P)-dependent dehydrogenase (short-subunit alcohol dehydrogenase family)